MKKTRFGILWTAILLMFGVLPAFAQTNVAPTTLTSAISQTDTTFAVGSTSGMTASATGAATFLLIDNDLMQLSAIPVSGTVTVKRVTGSGNPTRHAAGVYVIYGTTGNWAPGATGSPTTGVFLGAATKPSGGCTLTSQQYSPVFNPGLGQVFACHGGKWASGPWPSPGNNPTVAGVRQCVIPIGSIALTLYGTTDTVNVSGTVAVSSIDIVYPRVISTLSNLTGTTAPTTDKQLFSLYDGSGNLIASSAIAGVAAATADIFFDQAVALVNGVTGTSVIVLPGRYFLGVSFNGTTTSMQKIAIGTGYQTLVGNTRTGTFGTLANITVPTTLTDVVAPIACIS